MVQLLVSGQAASCAEAERQYLEEHVGEIVQLVQSPLSDAEFRRHPLIVLLLARGSRGFEDSLV